MNTKKIKSLSKNMTKHCKKHFHKYIVNPRGCKYYSQWCSKITICPIQMTRIELEQKLSEVAYEN